MSVRKKVLSLPALIFNDMSEKKYISVDGITYNSYQDYCNSMDLDYDIIGVMLATGRRQPQNEDEKELLKEIKEIKARGRGVEFPFN